MPIPRPNEGEEYEEFIRRCMGDDVMTREFDDEEQRRAVCEIQWEEFS